MSGGCPGTPLSRTPEPERSTRKSGRVALVLSGAGGEDDGFAAVRAPGWQVVRRGPGTWTDDLWPDLCAADVVVAHAGLGAVSDVAAAGKPAVVLARPRPHDEQVHTAAALRATGLAVVPNRIPTSWSATFERAVHLETHWSRWAARDAATRFAQVVADQVGRRPC